MTSARRRSANRANARASTGPRTAAGKARVARNARRHGLNLPALHDPTLSKEVGGLARAIAGADADAQCIDLACAIAAAQIDLVRVRRARRDLLAGMPCDRVATAQLAALDRYERRGLSRRKFAIRELDAARRAPSRRGRCFGETKPTGENQDHSGG